MNLLPRTLLPLLALSGLWISTYAAGTPAKPIAGGPQVASRIQIEFAIYYLEHPTVQPLVALRKRIAADAAMPQLVQEIETAENRPVVASHWVATARKDYTAPSSSMLKRFGHGLSPNQVDALPRADEALVIDFVQSGKDRINALRNAQTLVEQVARDTHGLLWDDETREVFTPDAWHERRVLGWAGNVPDVSKHTVIHMYPSGAFYRCITLGMRKFGEPDIVVEDVVASDSRPVGNLINVLAQALVEGSTADEKGQLALSLQQTSHPAVSRLQGDGLKGNAERSARLLLAQGKWEDGDPQNRLVRIAFDRYGGPDEHSRQDALLTGLYGSDDGVARVHHDARLLAARDAARAQLPRMRDAFEKGLSPGEYIQVKAPFATDSGGREWMWVEVSGWNGDRIVGTLENMPDDVKSLHAGQAVVVSQTDIFDYIFHHADGRNEGNTTSAVIEEEERAGQ